MMIALLTLTTKRDTTTVNWEKNERFLPESHQENDDDSFDNSRSSLNLVVKSGGNGGTDSDESLMNFVENNDISYQQIFGYTDSNKNLNNYIFTSCDNGI